MNAHRYLFTLTLQLEISMRVRNRSLSLAIFAALSAAGSCAWAAPTYNVTDLRPASLPKKYIQLNNFTYALAMHPSSTSAHPDIVVENWCGGSENYFESRPGTMTGTTLNVANAFNDSQQLVGYAETADADGNIYAADGLTLVN